MWKSLLARAKERDFQRDFLAVMLGKLLGLAALFLIVASVSSVFFAPAHAADAPPPAP